MLVVLVENPTMIIMIKHSPLSRLQWAFVLVSLISFVGGFQTPVKSLLRVARPTGRHDNTLLHNEPPNNDNDINKNKGNEDNTDLDDFLDKPFFDPDAVKDDDPAAIRWFANLVKNDYATAEALYSGVLLLVLVVLSQELLRMQLYGDGYVPFQAGVKPGQLF
jgi:hypothetical protein